MALVVDLNSFLSPMRDAVDGGPLGGLASTAALAIAFEAPAAMVTLQADLSGRTASAEDGVACAMPLSFVPFPVLVHVPVLSFLVPLFHAFLVLFVLSHVVPSPFARALPSPVAPFPAVLAPFVPSVPFHAP